jgi:hypothetical protein
MIITVYPHAILSPEEVLCVTEVCMQHCHVCAVVHFAFRALVTGLSSHNTHRLYDRVKHHSACLGAIEANALMQVVLWQATSTCPSLKASDNSALDMHLHSVPHTCLPAPLQVTPCNHWAHPECMRRWLAIKLECPMCRQPVPPI